MKNIWNRNKKGQMTLFMVLLLVGAFATAMFLLIIGLVAVKTNEALDIDVDLGQVNLAEVNNQTIGQYTEMVTQNADWWGLGSIFGMVFGIVVSKNGSPAAFKASNNIV